MAHAVPPQAAALPRHGVLDDPAVWQAPGGFGGVLPHGEPAWVPMRGICNHLSAMVPGSDELFLVNPYGWGFHEITASRLLVCDFEGRVIAGEGQPEATAFFIHAAGAQGAAAGAGGVSYAYGRTRRR